MRWDLPKQKHAGVKPREYKLEMTPAAGGTGNKRSIDFINACLGELVIVEIEIQNRLGMLC